MTAHTSPEPVARGTFLKRAVILYRQGRYPRMEEELRKELACDPEDAETLAWLGLALHKLDRSDEALSVLADATRLRPDLSIAHYIRALVLFRKGRVQRMSDALFGAMFGRAPSTRDHQAEAEAALLEALRFDPQDPDLFDLLAEIRIEQGRWEEALEATGRGLAFAPQHPTLLGDRGRILTDLKRYAEAREAFVAALAEAPESAWLHQRYGELLVLMGAPGPAVEHLREALRLAPNLEGDIRPLLTEVMRRGFRVRRWWTAIDSSTPLALLFWLVLAAPLVWLLQTDWAPVEIVWRVFPGSLSLPLLVLGLVYAIDPVVNLVIGRTSFGRLMLSREERRLSLWVGACLLVAAGAAVGWFTLERSRFIFGGLFAVFLIVPLRSASGLPWARLRTIAYGITAVAVVLLIGSLVPFFILSEEDFQRFWPTDWAVMCCAFFLLWVPFVLAQTADEWGYFTRVARVRGVQIFWGIQLLALAVVVGAHLGEALFSPEVRRQALIVSTVAGILFGLSVVSPIRVLDRLEKLVKRRQK